MAYAERFGVGYMRMPTDSREELFLSVAPEFAFGPGIQRDGLTQPRMTDPHTVQSVWGTRGTAYDRDEYPATDHPQVQRAGTWTIFDHVKKFVNHHGKKYRVTGVQSCGDLTMNLWHVALTCDRGETSLFRLAVPGEPPHMQEPIAEREYRCLVKWREGKREPRYEFIDLKFGVLAPAGYMASIVDREWLEHYGKEPGLDPGNITDDIEFALSGKPIVQRGRDIALPMIVDRFDDVRHVFNLPVVPASGSVNKIPITNIRLGEHVLYSDLNARRGALHSPIIVELDIGKSVSVDRAGLGGALRKKHFRESADTPTRRGEYRRYGGDAIEIFYPYNVYPFAALGCSPGEVVSLAAGGLSGRVGMTLEGVTRIMYDFFACEDAIVLDEGFDTFSMVNPATELDEKGGARKHKYTNEQFIDGVACFTRWRLEQDCTECRGRAYRQGDDLTKWPLNVDVCGKLESHCTQKGLSGTPPQGNDIVAVDAHRAQVRAVLVFAQRES